MSNLSQYVLQNVGNYKVAISNTIEEIQDKYLSLISEYLLFIGEKISISDKTYYNFILTRGLITVSHVFNYILYYSKNINMAYYHGQKAFYYYVEFIGQITDNQNVFLQLSSRDAALFVYKKTIYEINNDYKKTMPAISAEDTLKFEIMDIYVKMFKQMLSFFIGESIVNFVSNIKTLHDRMIHIKSKLRKQDYELILAFIEKLNDSNITVHKYIEILEMFIKKVTKQNANSATICKKMSHIEFDSNINGPSSKFISWLVA